MKQLTLEDLDDLKLGSAVMGSGGGGDPSYACLMTQYLIETYGPIQILSVDELKEEDLVVPLSMMGAPLIAMERILSGNELESILQTIENTLQRTPTVVMAAEMGGANAFTPLLIAARRGLPVLDADMIGRAFPELQMSSCYIQALKATPAVMADCLGNTVVIETTDADTLEKIARSVTVAQGSSSAVGFYLMNGSQARTSVIPGTLSQALKLGRAINEALKNGEDPIDRCIAASQGKLLGRGTLIDIDQQVAQGFLQGSATLLCPSGKITLLYQNEYLLASCEGRVLASTPDLLVLMEENSGTPLTSESLRYGLQAALFAIPAPAIWQTEEGLKLVGPRAFGYDTDYNQG